MRPSSRHAVLDATVRLARAEGMGAVTFESVAAEAGLSRGGILYHFRSKDDLLIAMYEHLAAGWESMLLGALGKPYEESTATERVLAYVNVALDPSARSDITLLADPAVGFEGDSPAQRIIERWSPSTEEAMRDPRSFDILLARLVGDGLWLNAALAAEQLPAGLHLAIVERLTDWLDRPTN